MFSWRYHRYDDIRLLIHEVVKSGNVAFTDFCKCCGKFVLYVLNQHSGLKKILRELLVSIKAKKIVVIESGYMGAILMMLKVLANEVTFKLYTTVPFLYKTYKDFFSIADTKMSESSRGFIYKSLSFGILPIVVKSFM